MTPDLSGRTALVTGARRGIGRAIAVALAASGADIVLCASPRSRDALGATAEQMQRATGRRVTAVAADLTSTTEVERLHDEATRAHGSVDIVVNNAGGFVTATTTTTASDAEWEEQLALNLTAAFKVCRAFVPAMVRAGHGRVVNIGSVVASAPALGNDIGYTAAKAGLVGFTKQMALELARTGVTANVVNPGSVHTEHLDDYFAAAGGTTPETLAAAIPVGRLGRPEEVAAIVPYLASDAAAFTTGAVFDISGGAATAS